jgi:hypothetical protein|tara:strand:- start:917 stop:1603 length:687 start_codon:yes stop_codon:yes gene_type:complete
MSAIKPFSIFIIFASLFISGCLTTSASDDEKRVSLFFEVNGLDRNVESTNNSDSVSVSEFKFALNQFNLYAADGLILESSDNINAFIFGIKSTSREQVLVIDVGLGFSDVTDFNGYEMFLAPIEEREGILDNDFFGDETNYSIVITGLYNGQDFIFKSSANFNRRFETEVQLTKTAETLVIIKSVDVEDVFRGDDGNLLDPRDQENSAAIVENIRENLYIQGYASNQL